jgi:hypothetical protein
MTKPGDSQTKKTLHELAKEFPNKTYRELEKYRDADRQEEALGIGGIGHNQPPDLVEVMAIENDKLKKRAQEAEGELSILKGIETNRVKEAQARSSQLQDALDNTKKENNDLYNRIAELIEANEKEVKNLKWIKDHDYIFLIDENKKLHAEIKKLKEGIVDRARKAGL